MQSVARVLQHYYQVILGNFEELYRKNVVDQQRKALLSRAGGAPQVPGSGVSTGPQQGGVNGSSQPGQQDTTGAANVMVGQHLSNAQSAGAGGNNAATFSLQQPPQGDHQYQPSATPSMSGATSTLDGTPSQTSISGFSAQPSVKPASETEQDGLSSKRKLQSEEPDGKRVRQKTGQPFAPRPFTYELTYLSE
jgi:SWI/SNF chromatin-remodeling complex subunit SWI1